MRGGAVEEAEGLAGDDDLGPADAALRPGLAGVVVLELQHLHIGEHRLVERDGGGAIALEHQERLNLGDHVPSPDPLALGLLLPAPLAALAPIGHRQIPVLQLAPAPARSGQGGLVAAVEQHQASLEAV